MADLTETESIDRLFLELSQFTRAKTANEIDLLRRLDVLRAAVRPFAKLVLDSSGRIPHERLSLADWHTLVKAYETSGVAAQPAQGGGA